MDAVDGPNRAPVGRLRRLLRRSLLVAALAAAGWLLSVLFATSASAEAPAVPNEKRPTDHPGTPSTTPNDDPATNPADDPAARPAGSPVENPVEAPATNPTDGPTTDPAGTPATGPVTEPAEKPPTDEPAEEPTVDAATDPDATTRPATPQSATRAGPQQAATPAAQQSAGGLGGLVGGLTQAATHTVTHTAHEVTHTVVALSSAAVDHSNQAVTALLATPSGQPFLRLPDLGRIAPLDPAGKERAVPAHIATVPTAPPANLALPSTAAFASDHTTHAAVPQRTSIEHSVPGEHADKPGPGHPVQPPAPFAPGGTSVSNAHDIPGGARGTHGVLAASTSLPPPAAGFTTRSRAADATGRIAGLPATTPD
ncbi:hypothetical protein [Actinophytocola sp.]|uniref:hypothetical protein n=1 Tax=Actinophytocola sp. TaxID=1872138 RepID=UPI003D6A8F7A